MFREIGRTEPGSAAVDGRRLLLLPNTRCTLSQPSESGLILAVSLAGFNRFVRDGFVGVAGQFGCEAPIMPELNCQPCPSIMELPVNLKPQGQIAIRDV